MPAFAFSGCFLFSQSLKDTVRLQDFEVRSNFLVQNPGFKKVRIDSMLLIPQLHTDISTVLAEHSTIFIKSYGPGSLSTSSLRGTSSSHTAVEWNGISINSPMLGMTNLSQLPVAQANDIEILYGPASISHTIGAFGGVINLVTNPDWNNRISLLAAQTLASFSSYITDAGIELGNDKVQSITRVNYTSSKNDFPYYNEQVNSEVRQTNSHYSMGGFSEDAFFRFSNKYYLTARFWYSQNDTHIPPISTNIESQDKPDQKDMNIRSMIEGKMLGKKNVLSFRTAMVDQYMKFTDSTSVSNHQVYSWSNRLGWTYSGVKNLSFKPGVDFNYDWVISDQYDTRKTRSNVGVYAEFLYSLLQKVDFSLVLREDLIDGKFLPLIPGFGVTYKPFRKTDLSFNANLSRNYRYPSLNDLYWHQFGNPDLKPETDYATELFVNYSHLNRNRTFYIDAQLTGYYSLMDDMILWKPVSSTSSIPINISEVLARGAEAGLNLWWKIWKARISLDNNYSFCKSTSEKANSPNDASLGKQLIYIPVHSLNSTLTLSAGGFYLTYNFQIVSKRYTGNDNQTYMPAYSLSNINLGQNFHLAKIILSLQLQINNVFDLDYQSIANRPMAGRNFALTLRFNYLNPQKE